MKKIISTLVLICILLSLSACSGGLVVTANQEFPSDKKLIEVEVEEYGDGVYFTPNKTIKNVSVNTMIYHDMTDEFTVSETVYEANKLNSDECLRIILDLEKEIPYVMVKYDSGFTTYEQYLYRDAATGKISLLERE